MLKLRFAQLIFLFTLAVTVKGQITIKGQILDSLSTVEFANVFLIGENEKIVTGATTDENGNFSMSTRSGTYLLNISFLGYKDWVKKILVEKDMDLGVIKITPLDNNLEEVTVSAKKKIFQRKVDRLVFNVGDLPSIQGGDMIDVLNITPRIRILNDDITMIGKEGLSLMIDGKLIQLEGESLLNYLVSIPASDIEKVEIITSPPANFSAEGNSGIISIIYKKGVRNSWSGNLTQNYTQYTYARSSTGLNLDYNKNNLAVKWNTNYTNGSRLITDNNTIFFSNQTWQSTAPRRVFLEPFFNTRISVDYKVDDNLTVGFQYLRNSNELRIIERNETSVLNSTSNSIDSIIKTRANTISNSPINSYSFYTEFKLDSLGKKIKLELDHFNYGNSNNRTFSTNNFFEDNTITNQQIFSGQNIANRNINNYALNLEFALPLKETSLSFGGRYSLTKTDDQLRFFDTSSGQPVLDEEISNDFEFDENISALFVSARRTFNEKWETQIGFRFEYTETQGFSRQLDQTNNNDYSRLFPSVFVTFQPNDKNIFSLNFNGRIRRPSFEFLNPFQKIINPFSIVQGNPFLNPSFSNNLEFSYTKNNNWINTIYFSKTDQGFTQVSSPNSLTNVQITQPLNYYDSYRWGLNESVSFSIANWWETYNSFDFYYSRFDSNIDFVEVNRWEYSAYFSTNHSWSIGEKVSLNANFWLQFPTTGSLYSTKQFNNLDFSVKTQLSKQIQFTVTGYDVFGSFRPQYKEVTNGILSEYNNYYDNQSFRAALLYSFGNSKIKVKQKRFGNESEKRRISN